MTYLTKTIYHPSKINRKQKEKKNGHQSAVLWFTGLSGSGKSTLAHAVEKNYTLLDATLLSWTAITYAMAYAPTLGFLLKTERKIYAG